MIVMILGALLFASGIVIGFLFSAWYCDRQDDSSLKDAEIVRLKIELAKYKSWVDRVATIYRERHPDEGV